MGQYDFKEDLPVAQETEKEVAEVLIRQYNAEILGFNDDYKYDILARIKGKEFKIEVKEDFMCGDTGNAAVEFSCRGKPSGIQTTEADYYIYKMHKEDGIKYTIHKVEAIKKMIDNGLFFRIVNGGDKDSNSLNYLFKYNIFIRTGTEIAP